MMEVVEAPAKNMRGGMERNPKIVPTGRGISLILSMVLAATAGGSATPSQGRYAPVNGLRMYYEIHGVANGGQPPLVLLHGGGSTIDTSFGKVLPAFAKTRRVIAFEQQGHGHTADVDRPFSFEQSAEDTAALLKYLHVDLADFFGYSNGGNIALLMGIRHPDMVRKLIVESAMFKRDGLVPGFWDSVQHGTLQSMPGELGAAYLDVVPHPHAWRGVHDKCRDRTREFTDWRPEDIQSI